MNGQKSGRCWAIVPGLRRIPAPIVFPTATAIPNVRPSTVRSLCVPDWAEDTTRLYGPSPVISELGLLSFDVIRPSTLDPRPSGIDLPLPERDQPRFSRDSTLDTRRSTASGPNSRKSKVEGRVSNHRFRRDFRGLAALFLEEGRRREPYCSFTLTGPFTVERRITSAPWPS